MTRTGRKEARQQSRLPVAIALSLIGAVWVGSCVISFMEQIRLARHFDFEMAWLFPLIFDGLASALAVTSWSAALDGRHSPLLRLFTCLAVAGSAWVNAEAVMERTTEDNPTQIGMAVAVPIAAWIAFEFLLGELRRQIMRARGVPAPAAVPALRPVRLLLSPVRALREWRTLTLDVTDPRRTLAPSTGHPGDRSHTVTDPAADTAVRDADTMPIPAVVSGPRSRRTDTADNRPDRPDNHADTPPAVRPDTDAADADEPRPRLAAVRVPQQAPGPQDRTPAPAFATVPAAPAAPRVSAPDSTQPQVTTPARPPLSAAAPASTRQQADGSPDSTPAPAGQPDSRTDAPPPPRPDTRTGRTTVSDAVTLLMRQGITDPDEMTARMPDIVGREVKRDTVARTLRRQRAALDADAHTGNYL